MRTAAWTTILALGTLSAWGQTPPKKRVAIFDFDNAAVQGGVTLRFAEANTPNLGKAAADLLITKLVQDGNVSVMPVEMWLAAVRNMKAPKQLGLERHDEILSIDVVRELALLKLKLQIPPRHMTDMLLCLKVNGTWKIVQKVMTSETRL